MTSSFISFYESLSIVYEIQSVFNYTVNKLMNWSWNILEYLTFIEIKFSEYKKCIYGHLFKSDELIPRVVFISHNPELKESVYSVKEYTEGRTDQTLPTSFDFILYIIPVENRKFNWGVFKCMNVADVDKIINNTNANNIDLYNSNITFNNINIHLVIEGIEESFAVNFQNHNMLFENNVIFDFLFVKWYMAKHHNINISKDTLYTVSFFDHNMDFIQLSWMEYIIIFNKYKNKYIVVSNILDDKNVECKIDSADNTNDVD